MTTVERIGELVKSGKLEEAESALGAVKSEDIDRVDKLLYAAMILEKQCRWTDAITAYEAVLAEDEGNTDAAFQLAMLADRFGDDERAIELYELVASETPAHVNALLNLAVLYEDHERYDDALACAERVLADFPNHVRARLFYKDFDSALDMYYDENSERFREKRNAILETPITDFELSVRSRNCLKQMDIYTLGDLLRTTTAELLSYKNFGETSLHEIENMLTQKGLRLGQLLDDQPGELPGPPAVTAADPATASVLNRTVAELELSVRARKCLMRLGANTIGELVARSEPELMAIKNFGGTSLSEIKRRLADLGLSLRA
jgi:DNA-directed RNA polymerase subunit alpha